jgi:transposase
VAARQRIEEALLRGPRVFGYATDLWAIERVSAVIKKVARVRYAPRSAWYVLGSLGWSCQKPTARARERDERAIARWRKMTWPAIQKSGSGPRPA